MKQFILSSCIFLSHMLMAQGPSANWLLANHCAISAQIKQFDYAHYNQLVQSSTFSLQKPVQKKSVNQSNWQIDVKETPVKNDPSAYDYKVTFKCIRGILNQAGVSVKIDFDHWNPNNYVLFPSVAYNGNKYTSKKLRYSPKLYDVKDIGPNKPIVINDVPRLGDSNGISRIQERSGSMSTPSIGFVNPTEQKGVWLLTKQGNQWGDYGMGMEESRDRKSASMSISSPVVRELNTYTICDAHTASWDIPANYKVGDQITIEFRLYTFNAPKTQSIFDQFALIRKDLNHDTAILNTLTYDACMRSLEVKFNQQNYVPEFGYYAVGMRENYLQDWQIGWTGGMISTYPLLFAGNKTTVQNVLNNFDWLFPNGISPSGFYWDACQKGNQWIGGDIRNPHTTNWHLVRKSGDAVWYILKQFMLMEKMGIPVKSTWKEGNMRVCDAFVKLWEQHHQLGQFVDSKTGEIVVGGSSSGGIVIAALMLASSYYHNPHYAQVAKEMGDYYNDNFTKKGISCGGPGDALQAFDSESSYALVESFTTLYELTNDKKWLEVAENAAKQFATWVVSYNYQYNDTTAFFKAGIKTTGGVYANIQNKHSAPGICTASGVGLLKLYRFTGNLFYLNLLYDIAHNIPQYLPHPQKPLGNAPYGWVSERVNMTDWEGPQSIGYILPISTWAETSLMLTTIEIPGLYVDAHKSIFKAFDNLSVIKKSEDKTALVLEIKNPTKVDAQFSIMEESDALKVMGENAMYNAQKIALKAGESKIITFNKK